MEYKIIAFDLDGTFLDDNKQIPDENLAVLQEAHRRGIHVVPATGRVIVGIPEALRTLDFIRYYILGNGAMVYDARDQLVIYRAELPLALSLQVIDYMDTLPVLYDCYQNDKGWMSEDMLNRMDDYFQDKAMLRYVKSVRNPVKNLKETLISRGESVQKLQMHFQDMEERARQLVLLPKMFPELLASTSVCNNIEINSIHAGKDNGLRALCQFLQIPMSESVAFGDGTNDTAMLSVAGLGIAMANAASEAIAAADRVAPSNNEAGFAHAVREWVFSACAPADSGCGGHNKKIM